MGYGIYLWWKIFSLAFTLGVHTHTQQRAFLVAVCFNQLIIILVGKQLR